MTLNNAWRTSSGLLSMVTAAALVVPAAQATAVGTNRVLAVSPAALPTFPFGGPPGDPYACMEADVFGCSIVFGGSGIPIPHQDYIDAVNERFIQPLNPGFTPQALFTPEGLQPFTGVKTLPLDVSMAQGLTILQQAVDKQFDLGHVVNLYGYSQSASIDTLLMRQYLALPEDQRPGADQLSFTFLGNPNTPNGGLMQIFNLPEQVDSYVEIDPAATYTFPEHPLYTKCGWSPFTGMLMTGRVQRVVLRGQEVVRDGIVLNYR